MTSRRRFLETLRYGRPDRVPYFEEGLREGVLEAWRAQGLPAEADPEAIFPTDRRERIAVNLEPLPKVRRWPRTLRGLAGLRRRLDPEHPCRLTADWADRARAWRRGGRVVQLPLHRGFFLSMGVRGWGRFTEVMYLLSDAARLVEETMALYAACYARLAERILSEVKVDFVSFSEPIGGPDGPLLSPDQYDRFVLRSYRPVLEAVRRHGVEFICFITYANARALIPRVLDAGFNCLWACEANTAAMDYRRLRREFGRRLRLIGGIDLDALRRGKRAIRREVLLKVPPLLADGGYIPLADGRVRADVPLEHYCYYRRLLERVARG